MKEIEARILELIERNSRIADSEIALMLGISEDEVSHTLRDLEAQGVICGYHTMIDWDRVDVEKVTALIEVKVTPQRDRGFDQVAERIYNYPEVNSVYLLSGGYDLMVTLEGKTFKEVAYFVAQKLSTMEGVQNTATHYILKKYKDHGTIMEVAEGDQREVVS